MQTNTSRWQANEIDHNLIDLALAEDLGLPYEDLTTLCLIDPQTRSRARIISKHAGSIVVSGLSIVEALLYQLNAALAAVSGQKISACDIEFFYEDGAEVPPGAELLRLSGQTQTLLMAERTLLNFLQRMSAIATNTAAYVQKVKHTQAKILDTRKTTPGWRHLEKYAVRCGGGVNHRMGLYDALMVKDTHVDALGGMQQVLAKLPDRELHSLPVIIEVRDLEELAVILNSGLQKTSRVLLDNMSVELMRECVARCHNKIETEASGSMSLENVAAVAATGVQFISIGKLTHSAGNVDLSMKCDIGYDA